MSSFNLFFEVWDYGELGRRVFQKIANRLTRKRLGRRPPVGPRTTFLMPAGGTSALYFQTMNAATSLLCFGAPPAPLHHSFEREGLLFWKKQALFIYFHVDLPKTKNWYHWVMGIWHCRILSARYLLVILASSLVSQAQGRGERQGILSLTIKDRGVTMSSSNIGTLKRLVVSL